MAFILLVIGIVMQYAAADSRGWVYEDSIKWPWENVRVALDYMGIGFRSEPELEDDHGGSM